jgi:hypothetical protein
MLHDFIPLPHLGATTVEEVSLWWEHAPAAP